MPAVLLDATFRYIDMASSITQQTKDAVPRTIFVMCHG
jgi:hypothetical protein